MGASSRFEPFLIGPPSGSDPQPICASKFVRGQCHYRLGANVAVLELGIARGWSRICPSPFTTSLSITAPWYELFISASVKTVAGFVMKPHVQWLSNGKHMLSKAHEVDRRVRPRVSAGFNGNVGKCRFSYIADRAYQFYPQLREFSKEFPMSQSDLEPSGFKVWRRSALRQVQICVAQTLFEPLQIIGFTCYEMNQFGFYLEVGEFCMECFDFLFGPLNSARQGQRADQ